VARVIGVRARDRFGVPRVADALAELEQEERGQDRDGLNVFYQAKEELTQEQMRAAIKIWQQSS